MTFHHYLLKPCITGSRLLKMQRMTIPENQHYRIFIYCRSIQVYTEEYEFLHVLHFHGTILDACLHAGILFVALDHGSIEMYQWETCRWKKQGERAVTLPGSVGDSINMILPTTDTILYILLHNSMVWELSLLDTHQQREIVPTLYKVQCMAIKVQTNHTFLVLCGSDDGRQSCMTILRNSTERISDFTFPEDIGTVLYCGFMESDVLFIITDLVLLLISFRDFLHGNPSFQKHDFAKSRSYVSIPTCYCTLPGQLVIATNSGKMYAYHVLNQHFRTFKVIPEKESLLYHGSISWIHYEPTTHHFLVYDDSLGLYQYPWDEYFEKMSGGIRLLPSYAPIVDMKSIPSKNKENEQEDEERLLIAEHRIQSRECVKEMAFGILATELMETEKPLSPYMISQFHVLPWKDQYWILISDRQRTQVFLFHPELMEMEKKKEIAALSLLSVKAEKEEQNVFYCVTPTAIHTWNIQDCQEISCIPLPWILSLCCCIDTNSSSSIFAYSYATSQLLLLDYQGKPLSTRPCEWEITSLHSFEDLYLVGTFTSTVAVFSSSLQTLLQVITLDSSIHIPNTFLTFDHHLLLVGLRNGVLQSYEYDSSSSQFHPCQSLPLGRTPLELHLHQDGQSILVASDTPSLVTFLSPSSRRYLQSTRLLLTSFLHAQSISTGAFLVLLHDMSLQVLHYPSHHLHEYSITHVYHAKSIKRMAYSHSQLFLLDIKSREDKIRSSLVIYPFTSPPSPLPLFKRQITGEEETASSLCIWEFDVDHSLICIAKGSNAKSRLYLYQQNSQGELNRDPIAIYHCHSIVHCMKPFLSYLLVADGSTLLLLYYHREEKTLTPLSSPPLAPSLSTSSSSFSSSLPQHRPNRLKRLTTFDAPSPICSFECVGKRVYLATLQDSLLILKYDTSSSLFRCIAADKQSRCIHSLFLEESHQQAYLLDRSGHIHIVSTNFSNPPRVVPSSPSAPPQPPTPFHLLQYIISIPLYQIPTKMIRFQGSLLISTLEGSLFELTPLTTDQYHALQLYVPPLLPGLIHGYDVLSFLDSTTSEIPFSFLDAYSMKGE